MTYRVVGCYDLAENADNFFKNLNMFSAEGSRFYCEKTFQDMVDTYQRIGDTTWTGVIYYHVVMYEDDIPNSGHKKAIKIWNATRPQFEEAPVVKPKSEIEI